MRVIIGQASDVGRTIDFLGHVLNEADCGPHERWVPEGGPLERPNREDERKGLNRSWMVFGVFVDSYLFHLVCYIFEVDRSCSVRVDFILATPIPPLVTADPNPSTWATWTASK